MLKTKLLNILVCQLWNKVATKQWKKITEITWGRDFGSSNAPTISSKDAARIAQYATPFIRVLHGVYNSENKYLIAFGSFLYCFNGNIGLIS